jgi:hypothetical protein
VGDPVHGSVSYYAEIATAVVKSVRAAIMEDGSEPPAKRARLESTIVRRPSVERPSKPHHSASWSTGTLPPTQGRGGNTRGGAAELEVVAFGGAAPSGGGAKEGTKALTESKNKSEN